MGGYYYDGMGWDPGEADEISAGAPAASFFVKEEDGTSKLTLEEGGGSLKTEESV